MSSKVIVLGAGAAPGVPSLCRGFGACNPDNPKNIRRRVGTYYELGEAKILIDTSPDLRLQLIDNQIKYLDAVLYTHSHADHLHGIDDLREINRISNSSLNIYSVPETMNDICARFDYLITTPDEQKDCVRQPSLIANKVEHNEPFFVKGVKITPIKLVGHNLSTTGYVFNDGEIIHIADFRALDDGAYEQIQRQPELMILPLTVPYGHRFHAGLEEIADCIEKINPKKVIINHMASECDYDEINTLTPSFVVPAYDNMIVEL